MAGISKVPWPDIWKGLPAGSDDTAVAEHALRAVARARVRPWTKSDIVAAVTLICGRRWGGGVPAMIRGDRAVRRAWDRLVGTGVILWQPRQPLRVNL